MTEPFRVVALCLFLAAAMGYPSGAPQSTCGDLYPRHGDLKPQESESPFELKSAIQRVTEGNKLRLVLSSPSGDAIAGFMVQARALGANSGSIGTFTADPEAAKTLTCGAGIKNTLTHTNNKRKKTLEIEWEPPAGFNGSVVFNSTFVKDGATFWVGVESEPVLVVRRSLPDANTPQRGISTTKIPIRVTTVPNYTPPREVKATAERKHEAYTGCGDQKLCFGYPDGCVDSGTCSGLVAVVMSPAPPNDFTFELLAPNSKGYIAVGLSQDKLMGDDNVVACTTGDKKLSFSRNVGTDNEVIPDVDGIELASITNTDGSIYCKFMRKATTNIDGTIYDLKNKKYYLLLAQGGLGEDKLNYHFDDKQASASSLALSEITVVEAASKLLYRLHGAFMLAAWIGFAGTGMLVARYFKKTWVGTQACGKDIWFAWHRGFMVLTWLLTCAGFIIIFVEVGGWYGETSNPHGVLGVVTTGLAFIQPFGAALRPAPSSSRRPLFNWSHWLVGNAAHILAIITIFFARQLGKAELPDWVDWIVSVYVAFHFVMHILFSVTDCCSSDSERRVNSIPMKEFGGSARMNHFADTKRDAPRTGLRKFFLAIYLIVVIALTVALVVIAALAPIEDNSTVKKVVDYLMPSNGQ